MPRSLIGPLSSSVRREDLPWSAVVALIAAALLVNGVGLYGTSTALSRALQHESDDEREDVTEFSLVEPDSDDDAIVSQHRANDRAPEDTEHLSDVDSDVERETQAPLGPDSATSKQTEPGPALEESERARGRKSGEQGQTDDGTGQDAGSGQQPGAGDDTLVEADDGASATAGADAGSQQGKPDPLTMLGGSPSVLDQTFGRPGNADRLRDVDEGVENVLDSKRHVYGSFFNRVRDQVADNWRPEQVHRRADPNGSRYGDAQRTTVLMVRVDEHTGEILKIVVEQRSGAPHLDDEAVRAMRAAAPFPNIPPGLADANGHVDFRFGFILDFVGGPRIFRYSR